MLVFTKGKDQGIKYISKVRNKFCTSLLFQGSKGTIIKKKREITVVEKKQFTIEIEI